MKGFARTLEAVISVILIYTFLVILTAPESTEAAPEDLTGMAYELLGSLDSTSLRAYASEDNFTAINDSIEFDAKNHTINVCNPDGDCTGPEPDADEIWSAFKLVAGNGEYEPKLVKLYLY